MNTVQDTLRKLKPIIGKRADQFWIAYLSEDLKGKAELETVLNLWASQLLGNEVSNRRSDISAPPKNAAAGEYPIGNVVYANKTMFPFGLREDEWLQHTAIFGRSGAGKTNVGFIILNLFLQKKKPFLIFDWKRNYRDLLAITKEEIAVFTVGRGAVPFQFNPLIPPEGTNPSVWLKKLIEIVAHSYYVGEGVMFLLQEAIHSVYEEFGVYTNSLIQYPTFTDVYTWLESHPVKGRKAMWMDSAVRSVKSICFGFMGNVINTPTQPNIASLLHHNVILELDSLTNSDKTMIIESLLLWIHHYRLVDPHREVFKHAIIIEEAHHILLRRTGSKQTITETVLREIRELGEAIILIDQHPSLISIQALGNSYTTITLNLKHKSDVAAIAAAMLLDTEEREIIGRLPIGGAVVKLQGRWVEPFRISIPLVRVPKGKINDAVLCEYTLQRNLVQKTLDSQPNPNIKESTSKLSQKDIRFLVDVNDHSFSGVVERYKRLNISRRNGNKIKERLLELELIKQVSISTRSGKISLLELTGLGVSSLRLRRVNVSDKNRWGGLIHEYFKHRISKHFQKAGYNVTIEEPVNGFTDIVIERNNKRIAIEIETGQSDWRKNIQKNLKKDFSAIFIIATNNDIYDQATSEINSEYKSQNIRVFLGQQLI